MKEIYREIARMAPDKILEPFGEMYRLYGFDLLDSIVSNYGGSPLYVPTWKVLLRAGISDRLKQEFDGKNYIALAVRYGLCERTVRRIVNEK